MKPIKIKIKNYQSIRDVEFDVVGFTTITGKTNIGKSAIIRAVSSAILNNPVTNMIRYGEKQCSVEMRSEDWGFKWEKAEKGTNRYYVDGKEHPLDSVGRGQIKEIADMGFGMVKIGESKYLYPWYASQYDPIFLLNQSGPAVTDFISEVSRLDVLQNGISISNKKKKGLKDKSKLLGEEIKKLNLKKSKLTKLDEMNAIYADLKLQRTSINEYINKITNLKKYKDDIDKNNKKISLLSNLHTVIIPEELDNDIFKKCIKANNFNDKLKFFAKSIISIRNINSVIIPEELDNDEIFRLEKLLRFSKKINELKKSIYILSPNISIPEELDDGHITNLEKLKKFALKKVELENSINTLSTNFSIPEEIDEVPEKLIDGTRKLKHIKQLQAEIMKLENDENMYIIKLDEIDEMINKIPRCPTCEQPWNEVHGH